MPYSLVDLIDDRNRSLHTEISAQLPIELTESSDDGWGAIIRNKVGVIECASSSYPISCFTHELLHLKFDLAGMERPGFCVRAPAEKHAEATDSAQNELLFFYNQLVHQKLFDEFVALGFPANEFLAESDRDAKDNPGERDLPQLEELARKRPSGLPCSVFIFPYLYLSSPHDQSARTKTLLKRLRNISDTSFYQIGKLLRSFREEPHPDVRKYIGMMFLLCGNRDVGLGNSEDHLIWSGDLTAELARFR